MTTTLERCSSLNLLAIGMMGLAACSAQAQDAAEVLARARRAVGVGLLAEGSAVRLSGTTRFLGTDGTIEAVLDASGRSVVAINGPISQTNGFDGASAWTRDFGGETRRMSLGERENGLMTANVLAGRWLAEDSPVSMSIDSNAVGEGEVALAFQHDGGRATGTVVIDRATWRPTRWTMRIGAIEYSWTLSGALEAQGMTFPASIALRTSNGVDSTMTFTSAEVIAAPEGRFAQPHAEPGDARFDPSASTALEIKKAPTGHLLVKACLDGGEPGWFIFDTGAGMNCLSNSLIAARGYEKVGEVPAMGVGGSVASPLVRPKSLRVGPMTLNAPLCVGLDLDPLSAFFGESIQGIVGYNVIARCVAEIDTETPAVSLHDPAAYRLEGGEWTDLIIYERHPCFTGMIEGHEGVLKIDTGAAGPRGGTITVHAAAVRRFNLLEGRETTPTKMGGVGGFVDARKGTLALVEFAGIRAENVEAAFALEGKGAFADPYVVANVGARLLAPYRVVLDYQRERAALIPK